MIGAFVVLSGLGIVTTPVGTANAVIACCPGGGGGGGGGNGEIVFSVTCAHSQVSFNGVSVCSDSGGPVKANFGGATGSTVVVTVDAVPDAGYGFTAFDGLSGGCFGTTVTSGCPTASTSNPVSVAASCPSGDQCTGTLTADYAGILVTLACSKGTVTMDSSYQVCNDQRSATFYFGGATGQDVSHTFAPSAASGYMFGAWGEQWAYTGLCFGVIPACGNHSLTPSVTIWTSCPAASVCQYSVIVTFERTAGQWPLLNWAGYGAGGVGASILGLEGTWIQPAVTCPNDGSTSDVALWAGMDGYRDSDTPVQAGTEAFCSSGSASYYAWYEYPGDASPVDQQIVVSGFSVNPNDVIAVGVDWWSGTAQVGFSVIDFTQNEITNIGPFSVSSSLVPADSAECVLERTSDLSGNMFPLASFGAASFGGFLTGHDGCTVEATSATASIGRVTSLSGLSLDEFTMVNGATQLAQPSHLWGSSFTVTWQASS